MDISIQIMTSGSRFTFIAMDPEGNEFIDSDYFKGIDYEFRNEAVSAGVAFANARTHFRTVSQNLNILKDTKERAMDEWHRKGHDRDVSFQEWLQGHADDILFNVNESPCQG